MTQTQNRLINYLKEYCFGKSNAISKDRLARYFDITTRELRKLKGEIVLEMSIPIGSTKNGYYYAETNEEIDIFGVYYKSRALKEIKMWKKYKRMKNKREVKQLELAGIK